jgi:hypothetical protein
MDIKSLRFWIQFSKNNFGNLRRNTTMQVSSMLSRLCLVSLFTIVAHSEDVAPYAISDSWTPVRLPGDKIGDGAVAGGDTAGIGTDS